MLQPKVILAPIDFSDSSLEALDVARDLAGRYGSEIVLVHAVPVIPEGADILSETSDEEDLIDQAQPRLAELVDKLKQQGLRARSIIGEGNDAGSEILRIADAQHADLIVIATHGMTGLRHLAFGSVTEKVVRSANCPVLVLRKNAATESDNVDAQSASAAA
jgi:nucleotide-binding universal stress UspA family protein